jgi:hypothetical protein
MPLSSAAFVVRRCCCPRLPPLSATAIVVRRRHHHCHSAVSAFSCCPLLSFPILVCRPILHTIVFGCYHCLPLPLLSAAAIFHCCSHHHHSTVSAVSHCPLSSFPIAVRHPILLVVIVCHSHHPPPLLSNVPVPLPILSLTLRC